MKAIFRIKSITLLFLLVSTICLSMSCTKDPEVVTETIYVTDTLYLTVTDTVEIERLIEDTATVFFLVRHAEKANGGSDPDLSAAGMERAERLAEILSKVDLTAIYSSDFKRTKQTAQPTADEQQLPVSIYDVFDLEGSAELMMDDHRLGKVLVVGHSNTTPRFANVLLGKNELQDFDESEYGDLLIVSVDEIGEATLVWLKF